MSAMPPLDPRQHPYLYNHAHNAHPQPHPVPVHRSNPGLVAAFVLGSLAALLIGGSVTAVEAAALHNALAGPPTATQPGAPSAPGSTTTSAGIDAVDATDDQKIGVVTIDTDLYYGEGAAAGTGMILSSDGTILTNNHVVEGSTTIKVTVESTGQTFTAGVVGTDPTDDIAVLKLEGASGLTTVDTVDDGVTIGDVVTSIGNAGGTGDLLAATGEVTATGQTISVADELTKKPKSLRGLIEVDADVVSGDSGGPLIDKNGDVVGVVTAASSGGRIAGYAIPITTALAVAADMLAGKSSDTISLGLPAFLGVTIDETGTGGAVIATVLRGGAAEAAGLNDGCTITAVDGVSVSDHASLSAVLDSHKPGDTIVVTYTDAVGKTSTASVTLGSGPAE